MSLTIQKQLTELLIFSRLDYCNNVFINLPQYQIKQLLNLQKICAYFVVNIYATYEDITKLMWLLIPEIIHFNITKFSFKGLLKENVPDNLEIQVRNSNRSLRTPNKITLEYTNLQKQQSFYINCPNILYNELPNEIKKYEQYSTAVNQLRKYIILKTFARALSKS